MAANVTNYKCPNCEGALHFAGDSGQVECDYCGSKFDVTEIERLYAEKDEAAVSAEPQWDTSMAGSTWDEDETARMRAYICPSCAAEIICDDTTAATSCPYCGNPTVVPGQFAGTLRPDYVIPFRLEKQQAVAALSNYYKGKKFLPDGFADANHIEEIKGVYVPFWLFDGETDATIRYGGTVVHTYRRGDEEIRETEYYDILRKGSVIFERVPVDGSTKMPDAHMDAIEPFDYGELKPFSSAYLPGFLADKYDMDAEVCARRANERIKTSTQDVFRDTVTGYHSVQQTSVNIRLERGEVKYAFLPVWMLVTKWQEKSFLFAMNGQTGKLIGDLPVDRKKFWKWFAVIAGPLAAVLAVICFVIL